MLVNGECPHALIAIESNISELRSWLHGHRYRRKWGRKWRAEKIYQGSSDGINGKSRDAVSISAIGEVRYIEESARRVHSGRDRALTCGKWRTCDRCQGSSQRVNVESKNRR